MNRLFAGAIAGTVGTASLNAITYLDMAVRGRPPSDLPARAVGRWADRLGRTLGGGDQARHRREALGALAGYATGLAVGSGYGVVRMWLHPPRALDGALLGLGAMTATNAALIRMGLTDPRSWGWRGWLADLLPHLGFGYATAEAYTALAGRAGPDR